MRTYNEQTPKPTACFDSIVPCGLAKVKLIRRKTFYFSYKFNGVNINSN